VINIKVRSGYLQKNDMKPLSCCLMFCLNPIRRSLNWSQALPTKDLIAAKLFRRRAFYTKLIYFIYKLANTIKEMSNKELIISRAAEFLDCGIVETGAGEFVFVGVAVEDCAEVGVMLPPPQTDTSI
jgi:hypothetical protein